MGFSVTLSHILMVIGSVVLASGLSAYVLYTGQSLQSNILQNVSDIRRQMSLQVQIVYATIDNSTTPSHFVVYTKNIGWIMMNNFTYLDVYVGEYGKAMLYTYSATASNGTGTFNLTDANGDSIWEPRETAVIRAYPTSDVEGVMFEAKVVPFRGLASSYLFPSPP
ncbi:MAG: hypothetical protein OEX77_05605 [Candidatus Bathyarchaeota archaeon]|nr:hypothetical protein [Candidatus Bathyarchaeota archaeon]MDH5733519.1 hypothetical protein [Candidatus Bathyarchaeota archaeon]